MTWFVFEKGVGSDTGRRSRSGKVGVERATYVRPDRSSQGRDEADVDVRLEQSCADLLEDVIEGLVSANDRCKGWGQTGAEGKEGGQGRLTESSMVDAVVRDWMAPLSRRPRSANTMAERCSRERVRVKGIKGAGVGSLCGRSPSDGVLCWHTRASNGPAHSYSQTDQSCAEKRR